ncbi:hypothetical protein PInf_007653 [Phytophthora infestans]|nr:hypothetical protein PInf_007653 [Phytophthora infestans]
MSYFRHQGWLSFAPLPSVPPATQFAKKTPCSEPAAAKAPPKPRAAAKSTVHIEPVVVAAVAIPIVAEDKQSTPSKSVAKSSATKNSAVTKPAAKTPSASMSAAKRSSSHTDEMPQRKRAAVDETRIMAPEPTVADMTAATIPDTTETVSDLTDISIPDGDDTNPNTTEEPVPEATTTGAEVRSGADATGGRSLLDAFDLDDFLDALRSDRLFGPLESDDLNVGDEASIIHDDDSNAIFEVSNVESVENETEVLVDVVDEDPVTFDLDASDLDRLQKEE